MGLGYLTTAALAALFLIFGAAFVYALKRYTHRNDAIAPVSFTYEDIRASGITVRYDGAIVFANVDTLNNVVARKAKEQRK